MKKEQIMTSFLGKGDWAVFVAILAIITLQLIRLGDYPGLYFDAVNPDYIAVQLLYPQDLQTRWQIAWPWLCQIYHGNVGIIITIISVFLTSGTGVLQYHITYGIVASIAVFLTYRILTNKTVGVPKLWAGLGSLMLISWPSLLTIIITQFYMCLFGTVCVLEGILLFLRWLNNIKKNHCSICLCYFLFGLAFYSYFNFFFFLPSLIVFTLIALRNDNRLSFDSAVTPFFAYFLGCGLYLVGWSQIAIIMNGTAMTFSRSIELLLTVYAFLVALFVFFYRRLSGRIPLLIYFIAGAGIWAIKVLPFVVKSAEGLGIVQNTTFLEKIAAVFRDYSYILTGKYAEVMVLGKTVTIFNNHVLLFFAFILFISLVVEIIFKKRDLKWKIPAAVIAVYICGCVGLGTRMQPQHYVPMVFLTYLCFILCMQSIFEALRDSETASFRLSTKLKDIIFIIMVLSTATINLLNNEKIINEIRHTGGNGYWSVEMTDLAKEAIHNRNKGLRELYIFQDWGFFAGFDYLTMNTVPYVAAIDRTVLAKYYSDGNDIVACYWKSADTPVYADVMRNISGGNGLVTEKKWIDHNGRTEFYEIRLSHAKH